MSMHMSMHMSTHMPIHMSKHMSIRRFERQEQKKNKKFHFTYGGKQLRPSLRSVAMSPYTWVHAAYLYTCPYSCLYAYPCTCPYTHLSGDWTWVLLDTTQPLAYAKPSCGLPWANGISVIIT